jgi:ABC-type dipeptide/oligopeptide/nickel transport system permease subunit
MSQGVPLRLNTRRASTSTRIGLGIGVALIGFILAAPLTGDPTKQTLTARLLPPGQAGVFGTDHLGRDLLARTAHGGLRSLGIALAAMGIALPIGALIGIIAGMAGGITDIILMRIVELFFALPGTIVTIAVAGALGPGLFNLLIALTLTMWTTTARLARTSAVEIRSQLYVEAAWANGCSRTRIAFRHVAPGLIEPLLTNMVLHTSHTMVFVAGLSFLGLGVQPPNPEWGSMLNDARPYIATAPHLILIPSAAIIATVYACSSIARLFTARWDR